MTKRASYGAILLTALTAAVIAMGLIWWWGGVYATFIIGLPIAFAAALAAAVVRIRYRG